MRSGSASVNDAPKRTTEPSNPVVPAPQPLKFRLKFVPNFPEETPGDRESRGTDACPVGAMRGPPASLDALRRAEMRL